MKPNEGSKDRVIRLFLGVIISSVGIYLNIAWLALLGIPVFLTGAVGICPIYKLLRINTVPQAETQLHA